MTLRDAGSLKRTIRDWQQNPHLRQLARGSRWPSIRDALITAGAVGAVGLVITLAVLLTGAGQSLVSPVPRLVIGLAIAVGVLGVPLCGVAAGAITTQDVQSDSFRLIKISALPREDILSGYLLIASYRLRLLWAVEVGLLAPLLVSLITYFVTLDIGGFCSGAGPGCQTLGEALPFSGLLSLLLVAVGVLIVVALSWLSLCGGVWVGLRLRQTAQAVLAATGFGLLLWLSVGLIFLFTKPAFPLIMVAVCIALFFIAKEIRLSAERMI